MHSAQERSRARKRRQARSAALESPRKLHFHWIRRRQQEARWRNGWRCAVGVGDPTRGRLGPDAERRPQAPQNIRGGEQQERVVATSSTRTSAITSELQRTFTSRFGQKPDLLKLSNNTEVTMHYEVATEEAVDARHIGRQANEEVDWRRLARRVVVTEEEVVLESAQASGRWSTEVAAGRRAFRIGERPSAAETISA